MNEFFQLIDRMSGNVIKDYEAEADALHELDAVARAHGFDEIHDFALLTFQDGLPIHVAMEDELVALVQAVDPQLWAAEIAPAGAAR